MKLSTMAAAVPAKLRNAREDLDLEQQWVAAQLGVTNSALLRWEKGRENPRTRHMLAYARLLNLRLTVGRGHQALYNLENLLPRLAAFRRTHNLSQQNLADRMHINATGVSKVEQKLSAGKPVGWDLTVRYLAGLGYHVGIARAATEAVKAA